MKKLIALLTVFGFLTFGIANTAFAQEQQKADEAAATEQVAEEVAEAPAAPATAQAELSEDPDDAINQSLHYTLKDKFIQGGAVVDDPRVDLLDFRSGFRYRTYFLPQPFLCQFQETVRQD